METGAQGMEFERKFLVTDTKPSAAWDWEDLAQGYLFGAAGYSLRVRRAVSESGVTECTMTLKGPRSGLGRPEAEWSIPAEHGEQLLAMTRQGTAKRRSTRYVDDLMWTVDVFTGDNAGLVMAEVEGPESSVAAAEIPDWCGMEVTEDSRYTNGYLSAHPYRSWPEHA